MKKLLAGLIILGSVSSFANVTSEFERGFNQGKKSCTSDELYLCVTPKVDGWQGNNAYTGRSRNAILKNLKAEFVRAMLDAGKDLECTKL